MDKESSKIIVKVNSIIRGMTRFFHASPRNIFAYFVHGLIITIPLIITLWVLVWVFNLVDGMLGPILEWAFGRSLPGLGFAIIIFCLILIGYMGLKYGHRRAFSFFEIQVMKIPGVGTIYGGVRQIIQSFTASSGSKFLEVVFMEFPRKGIYTIGLVTSEVRGRNGEKILNVFIPTAPNPTSGFLQIVPESDVSRTTMSVNDAMKLIISAGKVSHSGIANLLDQVPEKGSKSKVIKTKK